MSILKTKKSSKRVGRPRKNTDIKTIFSKKLYAITPEPKISNIASILEVSGTAAAPYLRGDGAVPDARGLALLSRKTGIDLNWLLNDDDPAPESEWPVLVRGQNQETVVADNDMIKALRDRIEELEKECERLRRISEAKDDALVSMKEDLDRTKEAAKTAGSLHHNGAAGA